MGRRRTIIGIERFPTIALLSKYNPVANLFQQLLKSNL